MSVANDELPISKKQAEHVATWMVDNFGQKLADAVKGTVFGRKHLCAIVCQETAFVWTGWLSKMTADEILARCVFDASGDASGTTRSAFPRKTAEFRERYGDAFTEMLIEEANVTRHIRGYSSRSWVYKGYGLFQYDLQHVKTDEEFFRQRDWYSFDACLTKAMAELKVKFAATGDLWKAIKAYNGSGSKAEQYKQNVQKFTEFCAPVTGD